MNHINCNETLFQIEDLMLNICLNRYYWRDAIVELEEIEKQLPLFMILNLNIHHVTRLF
jgi:hypothetical protein